MEQGTTPAPVWTKQENEELKEELRKQQKRESRTAEYLPSPKEIQRRCQDIRWLKQMNFPDRVIHMVMMDGVPSIGSLKHMVEKIGLRRTKKRVKQLLDDLRQGNREYEV